MSDHSDFIFRSFERAYRLVRLYYDTDRLVECIHEAKALLGEPNLPRYFQIKTYVILGCCLEDFAEAERCLDYADGVYRMERLLHPLGENEKIDLALDDCLEAITLFREVLAEEFETLAAAADSPVDFEEHSHLFDPSRMPTAEQLQQDVEFLELFGYEGDTDSEDLAEAEREVFAAGDLSIAEYRAMLMEFLPFASDEDASEHSSSDKEAEGAEQGVEPASAAPDLSTETNIAIEAAEELASTSTAERATSPLQDTEMQADPSHASAGRGGTLAVRNRLTGKQRMRRGQGKGEAPSSLRKLQQAFKGKDDEA